MQTATVLDFPGIEKDAPNGVSGTNTHHPKVSIPNRIVNDELRAGKKHLTASEINKIIKVARKGRYGNRDSLMVRMAFVHGLRIAELVGMKWSQVNFEEGTIYINRLKGSSNSVQNLDGQELRDLRKLQRENKGATFLFISMRGAPMAEAGFRKAFARWGNKTDIGYPVNPHMLRHGCGYELVNKGMDTRTIQGYLGHRDIRHTETYTKLSPNRFNEINLGDLLR